jgi:hypothetical protein
MSIFAINYVSISFVISPSLRLQAKTGNNAEKHKKIHRKLNVLQ